MVVVLSTMEYVRLGMSRQRVSHRCLNNIRCAELHPLVIPDTYDRFESLLSPAYGSKFVFVCLRPSWYNCCMQFEHNGTCKPCVPASPHKCLFATSMGCCCWKPILTRNFTGWVHMYYIQLSTWRSDIYFTHKM